VPGKKSWCTEMGREMTPSLGVCWSESCEAVSQDGRVP
jgi:hypothetical protein